MERITEYDDVRHCYVIKPEALQGQHIQRLGMYEDRDEAKNWILWTDDRKDYAKCPVCDFGEEGELKWEDRTIFCQCCGQRLE